MVANSDWQNDWLQVELFKGRKDLSGKATTTPLPINAVSKCARQFPSKKKRQTGCAAQADRIKPAKTLGAA